MLRECRDAENEAQRYRNNFAQITALEVLADGMRNISKTDLKSAKNAIGFMTLKLSKCVLNFGATLERVSGFRAISISAGLQRRFAVFFSARSWKLGAKSVRFSRVVFIAPPRSRWRCRKSPHGSLWLADAYLSVMAPIDGTEGGKSVGVFVVIRFESSPTLSRTQN